MAQSNVRTADGETLAAFLSAARIEASRQEMNRVTLIVEPSLDEMLADPIVRLMMAADQVEPTRVYALVRRVKRRPLRPDGEETRPKREEIKR
jgi:hypothetical protein